MCTDPHRSARRARHRFFGLFRHRVYGRDYEARPPLGPEDKRSRLLARTAKQEIAEELSISLSSDPEPPFFLREDYDPEAHLAQRLKNRVEQYLQERVEEELQEIENPLAA